MNQRVSGIFQIRSCDSACAALFETAELSPRPRVRALAWLVVVAALVAGSFGLWARTASEAGAARPLAGAAASEGSTLSALRDR